MKLSEAIRLGAMLRPQIFGRTLQPSGSCAKGAAAEAVGAAVVSTHEQCDAMLVALWPFTGVPGVRVPCGCWGNIVVGLTTLNAMLHLNDSHCWTREQIADWVATIEPAEVETPEVAPVAQAVTR